MTEEATKNEGEPNGARAVTAIKPAPMREACAGVDRAGVAAGGDRVAVALALLLGWHVVNGKHGLSVWEQKRAEGQGAAEGDPGPGAGERAAEDPRLTGCKSDPDAIEHEARETLHYAKPGEVIVDVVRGKVTGNGAGARRIEIAPSFL